MCTPLLVVLKLSLFSSDVLWLFPFLKMGNLIVISTNSFGWLWEVLSKDNKYECTLGCEDITIHLEKR